jgi:sugar porter (SP) family MFS transporter
MLDDDLPLGGLSRPSPGCDLTDGRQPKNIKNATTASAYVIFVSLVVALGGFVWGFDATVISGAVPFLKKYFDLTGTQGDLKLGLAVSCLGWGVLGGTAIAGLLSDRFGRKKVLIATAVVFTGSALLSALTRSFGVFVASRVLGGLAVGGAILIAPVYIAEISPARLRGSLVSLNQLMIVTGISGSFFSNYFLLDSGENNWRWMLGVEALPAALYFFLLFGVPESPRWLLGKGQHGRAREVLARVCGPDEAESQLQTIRQSFIEKISRARLGGLLGRRMRFVILIALTIAFFQQITGINAILYYAPTIFAQTGGGQRAAFLQAAIVGLDNLVLTVAAIWLIDRLGRKPLLIAGAAGMAASLLTCAWAFHASNYQLTAPSYEMLQSAGMPGDLLAELKSSKSKPLRTAEEFLADLDNQFGRDRITPYRDALAQAGLNIRAYVVLGAILGFVASFAISLGPVMWVLLSEIFPNQYRGAGISLAGFWNSAVSASVTLIFPWELSHVGSAATFFVYGILAVAALGFIVAVIPETKRQSLEELETQLVR